MFQTAPDVHDEVKNIVVGDDQIAVEFVSTGTLQNLSENDPPELQGKQFELKICSILKIENNRITRDATYYDQLAVLKQAGLL